MWPRIGVVVGVIVLVAASFVGIGRTGGAIALALVGGVLVILALAAMSASRDGSR